MSGTSSTTAAPGPPPAAPGAGAAISPEALQALVDRAANFDFVSVPLGGGDAAIRGGGGIVGVRIDEAVHRHQVVTEAPDARHPPRARDRVGERLGTWNDVWMLVPDDFVAAPGRTPPPTALDPNRRQRFVMLDSRCTLGSRGDGFRGFGAGHTLPSTDRGRPRLHAMAVGTILEGYGRFAGLEQGTWVSCGVLDPARGFTGQTYLRVMDPGGAIPSDRELSDLEEMANPEPGVTYVVFRGQAVPSDPVRPRLGPNGQPTGLIVEQGSRLIDVDCSVGGSSGVRTTARFGPWVGRLTADIDFDPSAPGGSAVDPIPFTYVAEFVFDDAQGRRVGSFTADASEGRVFKTQVGGFGGIRFGSVGRIHGGSGVFAGIEGLMTDNSVVIFDPHVSASVYVLHIHDHDGRFRARLGGGGGCGCGGSRESHG